jgi:hypothetical protein
MRKMNLVSGWLLVVLLLASNVAWGVKTHYIEHQSEKQFKQGEPNQVLISSDGELSLAYRSQTLLEHRDDLWVVNAMVKDSVGNLYVATSGTGSLFRIGADGETEEIYGQGKKDAKHLFSLAIDHQGRLLAGTGGEAGKLLRFNDKGKAKVLFEDETIKYIWSIVVGPAGRIYLGTGPTGKILTLNPQGRDMKVLFESKEKNILSLGLDRDGMLYAGGDEHGLIYRIDPGSQEVSIVYDSGHGEVSGLVFDEQGNLYAGTTDVKTARPGAKLILSQGQSDRSESQDKKNNKVDRKKRQAQPEKDSSDPDKPTQLIPPATPKEGESDDDDDGGGGSMSGGGSRGPAKANEVYQITPKGYVTSLFNKKVIVLSLIYVAEGELLIGTGNNGDLLSLDVNTQEAVVLHTARPSLQISSLWADPDGTVYVGCANPGQVLAIEPYFVQAGRYESEILDAEQISQWGKLQIEADIPDECELSVATRSGNTDDPEKGGWQEWTEETKVMEDIVVNSRAGRFLQYRLQFSQSNGEKTAVVKSVKLAYKSPNQAPKVEKLTVSRTHGKSDSEKSAKSSRWSVKWKGSDPNKDKLIYTLYLRMIGHQKWIRIAKELDEGSYKWNSLTVADGRYEIKVKATDSASNPQAQALSHARISRAFIVDNSGPEIKELNYELSDKTLKISSVVEDALSVIRSVEYSLNSAEKWESLAPQDGVYDSRYESVTFDVDLKEAGEHLIAIRYTDAMGNTVYRNMVITAP